MENSKNLIHSFNHTEYTKGNFNGLTKREYFAGLAMQSILSNSKLLEAIAADHRYDGQIVPERVIENSIFYADELLKQLEQ